MTLINLKESDKVKTLIWFLILAMFIPLVTAVDIGLQSAFSGQIKELSLTTMEGLSYENFLILLNEEPIREFSVENISEIDYKLLFRVPEEEGIYNLKIMISGSEEFLGILNVSLIKLRIETTESLISKSNLAYNLNYGNYAIGFASENQPIFTSNTVIVEATKNSAYIFLTSPTAQLDYINNLLSKQEFSTQINPLFGFIGLPSYFLSIYLTYPDVEVVGNQSFGFGSHNLMIERVTGDAPKTIRISSTDVENMELITTQE